MNFKNLLTIKKDGKILNQGLNFVKKLNSDVLEKMSNCRKFVKSFKLETFNEDELKTLIFKRDELLKQVKPLLTLDSSKIYLLDYQNDLKKILNIDSLENINIMEKIDDYNTKLKIKQSDLYSKIASLRIKIRKIEDLKNSKVDPIKQLTLITFYLFIENYRITSKANYSDLENIKDLELIKHFEEYIIFLTENNINFE